VNHEALLVYANSRQLSLNHRIEQANHGVD
jgi:hypothetical protein